MTISREYPNGPFVVQCDTCLDTEELEGAERSEAVRDAKRRGYTASFAARKWNCSYCTKAAEKAAERAFRQAEDRYEQDCQKVSERRAA